MHQQPALWLQVENARTLFVWLADLALFYTSHGKFGEAWDKFSWVQLIGFAIMTLGTTIYGKVRGSVRLSPFHKCLPSLR